MKTIKNKIGKETKIFAETFESEAYDQIKELCNFDPYVDSKIRIMPDAHAGKGCVVGTTMIIKDKITPNLVGVDIGCGMLCLKLKEKQIDFELLDKVIREKIPWGSDVHEKQPGNYDFKNLRCAKAVDLKRALLSIGTLGGGNHFIEIDKSEDGTLYLVIHSGSRHLGVQICSYYQNRAIDHMKRSHNESVSNKNLAFIEGKDFRDYMNDMWIVQTFASWNREAMADIIKSSLFLTVESSFETIHNYIDTRHMILRKGAVSAQKGEMLLIPINMRDGSLLCVGKGNADWNFSAPHGAGRLMSRNKAKALIDMDEFVESMSGIYSTTVRASTRDEAPQVYKSIEEIKEAIIPTVEVVSVIKPVYNFKG